MRLCANENIGRETVEALRRAGHDVLWVRESAPGSADADVLAFAQTGRRLLLTFDKDFGDLVYRHGALASSGVMLFRISQTSPSHVADRICAVVASRDDWEGHYSVVDDTVIRMRVLH
ncbi:MAG: DUF5615 family PIN-like protein [Verrucomicrobiota bacterium]